MKKKTLFFLSVIGCVIVSCHAMQNSSFGDCLKSLNFAAIDVKLMQAEDEETLKKYISELIQMPHDLNQVPNSSRCFLQSTLMCIIDATKSDTAGARRRYANLSLALKELIAAKKIDPQLRLLTGELAVTALDTEKGEGKTPYSDVLQKILHESPIVTAHSDSPQKKFIFSYGKIFWCGAGVLCLAALYRWYTHQEEEPEENTVSVE